MHAMPRIRRKDGNNDRGNIAAAISAELGNARDDTKAASTQVYIICGALGSGKTHLLSQIFSNATPEESSRERWAAVITEQGKNDFYKDVDSTIERDYYKVIRRLGNPSESCFAPDNAFELFVSVVGGGCICCSLISSPSFVKVISTIRVLRPAKLFIEVGLVADVQRLVKRLQRSFASESSPGVAVPGVKLAHRVHVSKFIYLHVYLFTSLFIYMRRDGYVLILSQYSSS